MNTVKQSKAEVAAADVTADGISDSQIARYLQAHPEFFERHQSLLGKLRLPHDAGGPAVSLVERQVSVLRQQALTLERKLKELLDVARGNDELAGKIHQLALKLLRAQNREEIIALLEEQLRTAFGADRSVLVLFGTDEARQDDGGFLRIVGRDDRSMGAFKTFLQSRTPRCGRIRDAQRDYLFGTDDIEIGSVAMVPLGTKCEVGFIAIGSRNADHFHPGKSIDFLARLGELVAAALRIR